MKNTGVFSSFHTSTLCSQKYLMMYVRPSQINNYILVNVLDVDCLFVLQVMYTDQPLVVSAPTGSGKTAVFELAIVRLMQITPNPLNLKMVYVAPIKALCSERCEDWKTRFAAINLECVEITGDTSDEDYFELQRANIIATTPVSERQGSW